MTRFAQSICLLCLLATVFLLSSTWPLLPETIPTHMGLSGQPDNFGPRNSIFLLPTLQLLACILLFLASNRPNWINVPFPIDRSDPHVRQTLHSFVNWLSAAISLQFTLLLDRFLTFSTTAYQSPISIPFWLTLLLPFVVIVFFLFRLHRSSTSVIN